MSVKMVTDLASPHIDSTGADLEDFYPEETEGIVFPPE